VTGKIYREMNEERARERETKEHRASKKGTMNRGNKNREIEKREHRENQKGTRK
jgi:hypothetical protein